MVAMTLPAKPWTNGMMTADGTRMFDSTVGSEGAWRATPVPAGGLPAGSIIQWGSNTAPPNWLICDGSAVSRALWPSLFATIGTTYGSGDGSTTFNLPDLRGRVAVGAGSITDPNNNTQVFTLAGKNGELTHKLTVAEMPTHNHGGTTGNAGSHNHYQTSAQGSGGLIGNTATGGISSPSGQVTNSYTGTSGDHNHSISSQGGDGYHNNLQPYLVTNYIIKATTGWSAGDSELALRMAAAETAAATTNKSGLVPLIPATIALSGGAATTNSNYVISFTNVTGISLNSVFSSLYTNYDIIIQGVYGSIDNASPGFRYRANGVDNASSQYYMAGSAYQNSNGGVSSWGTGVGAGYDLGRWRTSSSTGSSERFTIFGPAISGKQTQIYGGGFWENSSSPYGFTIGGVVNNISAYDGFTLFPSQGTMSGTIQVYGWR